MTVIAGRSRVATTYGIVAASQPLAARAGVQILERGGNAVDAAIAANAVLGVIEPQSNGIGGDLFAMIYDAKTRHAAWAQFLGWAPRGLTPALLRVARHHDDAAERHPLRDRAGRRCRLGRAARAVRASAAAGAARAGDPLRERRIPGVRRDRRALGGSRRESSPADQSAAATYLPGGRPPRAGDIFRNPRPCSHAEPRSRTKARRLLRGSDRRRDRRGVSASKGGTLTPPTSASSNRNGSSRSRRRIAAGPSTSCRRIRRASLRC